MKDTIYTIFKLSSFLFIILNVFMSYEYNTLLFDLHEDNRWTFTFVFFFIVFVSFLLTIIFLFVDFNLCYSHVSSSTQDW